MTRRLPNDERGSGHEGRFIAFGATGRAGNAKGRKMALPALPYSRPAALESLLSVALLRSVRHAIRILSLGFFYAENGLVFKAKMGLFSMLILIFTTV